MTEQNFEFAAKTYCLNEHPYVYVTLTDMGPGKGLLQIWSDWGNYGAFWGGMGQDRKLKDFILSCNSNYIENNLRDKMNYLGVKRDAYTRLTKFMAHCWPRVVELLKAVQ